MRFLFRQSLRAMVLAIPFGLAGGSVAGNRLEDPSFEISNEKDQFGLVFAKWGKWKYEGECEFRIGQVARTGRHSCLLFGGGDPKIRIVQDADLEPGRYRVTAFLRGLDIGTGKNGWMTELMEDGRSRRIRPHIIRLIRTARVVEAPPCVRLKSCGDPR
jgi:hypothetical protein